MPRARVTLEIIGFGCGGGGSLAVERELVHVAGVLRAYVNPATETAYVTYDANQTDPEKLVKAVERVGFRAGAPVMR